MSLNNQKRTEIFLFKHKKTYRMNISKFSSIYIPFEGHVIGRMVSHFHRFFSRLKQKLIVQHFMYKTTGWPALQKSAPQLEKRADVVLQARCSNRTVRSMWLTLRPTPIHCDQLTGPLHGEEENTRMQLSHLNHGTLEWF